MSDQEKFVNALNAWIKSDAETASSAPEEVRALWQKVRPETAVQHGKPMEPPWAAFPDIPYGSIGWRMGHGEDYMSAFFGWVNMLSEKERTAYIATNAEPADWSGFYEMIISRV